MLSRLNFNKISIIESLSQDERKTGQLLAHDLQLLEIFYDKGVSIECVLISDKQELITYIENLANDALNRGVFPILQIEAHGSTDKKSLVLNSGESIAWLDLEHVFRKLNIATKCNLLIVMATCFGAYISSTISLLDRAPFWGVIGPTAEVTPSQIQCSLTRFYTELYTGYDSKDLLASLSSKPSVSELKFITSEWFFVKAYSNYINMFCNDNALNIRVERLKAQLYEQGLRDIPNDEAIKVYLKPDRESKFYEYLSYFFMIDLYPDNIDKISVKYEQLNLRQLHQ